MDQLDLDNRFTYHPPVGVDVAAYQEIRAAGRTFADTIDRLTGPDSREKSLAVTKVEEAVMWANAARARHP